jgi:hypothetical protein
LVAHGHWNRVIHTDGYRIEVFAALGHRRSVLSG